jgi:IclR family acetate operon transcriptional repressor
MSKSLFIEPREVRIQSLARADSILSAVMANEKPITLGALSEAIQLNKTTVFNLAESLVVLGFLNRTKHPKGYELGLRCLELGRHVKKSLPVLEVSRPYLRELCQITRETVNLAVPYLQDALILEALQSQQAVRAIAYAGTLTHYHSSACGKALLAYFPEEQRHWLYSKVGLARMTEHTICDASMLETQLEEVRRTGVAYDRQENEVGAFCIGMAIFGPFDEVVGSISVSGVTGRMVPDFIDEIIAALRRSTAEIGKALGK